MALEIERKFLVSGDGWRRQVVGVRQLRQAYLAASGLASIRIRIVDDESARLTVKAGARLDGAALSRAEYEYPVPVADAVAMLDLRVGRVVEKSRHLVPADRGRTWEIDEFSGSLSGLVLAEIELTDPNEALALPDWIGEEVTGDPGYGNQALALRE